MVTCPHQWEGDMRLHYCAVAFAALFLAGCGSITLPASGVTSDGIHFEGTTTASMKIGEFSVSGNGITCSGTYDPHDRAKRIEAKTTCTDGRTGTIYVVRNNDGLGGHGTVQFTDGTTGTFVFGKKK